MSRQHELSDLQLAIMHTLWQRGEATVTDVHAALLDERGLAPTTIATLLKRLEKKGVVSHRVVGRQYVYRPAVTRAKVTKSRLRSLIEQLYDGDAAPLVLQLMREQNFTANEIAELQKLIDQLDTTRKRLASRK